MKDILSILFVIVIFFGMIMSCESPLNSHNPLVGKWTSLWDKESGNLKIDFALNFEENKSFHLVALGKGQISPQRVSGNYKITRDTILICDITEEPNQLCNYGDTGVYTFRLKNDTMFFKVIKDLCERRKLTLEIGLRKYR